MAHEYWDINRGQHDTDVVVGSSSGSGDVEVVVDLSKNIPRSEVIILLQSIVNKMIKGNWPPA